MVKFKNRSSWLVSGVVAIALLFTATASDHVEAAPTLRTFGAWRSFADVAAVDGGIAVRAASPYGGRGPVMWSRGGRSWRKIASAAFTLSQQRSGALAVNDAGVRILSANGSRRLIYTPSASGYERHYNDVYTTRSAVFLASLFWGDDAYPVVWAGDRDGDWDGSRTLPVDYNGGAEFVLPHDERTATIIVQESVGDASWVSAWRMRASGSYRQIAEPKLDLVTDAYRPSRAILGGRYTWPVGMTAARVASLRNGRWIRDTIRSVPRRAVRNGARLPAAEALVRRKAGRWIAGGAVNVMRCSGSYETCGVGRSLPVLWRKQGGGGWREQQLPRGGHSNGTVHDLALVRGQLIAVGSVWTPGSGRRAALWTLD